jgi:hypothetical protein
MKTVRGYTSTNGGLNAKCKKGRPHAFRQHLQFLTAPKSQWMRCNKPQRLKRRLRVWSASPFGDSGRSSQVAAPLVDGIYGNSSFAMIRSSLGWF